MLLCGTLRVVPTSLGRLHHFLHLRGSLGCCLLALESLTNHLVLLTLDAGAVSFNSTRLRMLFAELEGSLQLCDRDLGT